jgi:hypothetical protein
MNANPVEPWDAQDMRHPTLEAIRHVDDHVIGAIGDRSLAWDLPLGDRYIRLLTDAILQGKALTDAIDKQIADCAFFREPPSLQG